MARKQLISRAEVLAGFGGRREKRAHVLLALIENRTAQLVARAQQTPSLALTLAPVQRPEQAYLAAFGPGRNEFPPPTIQELEHFAEHWALLVPETAALRASLAQLLGQKYRFTAATIPAIRQALGLESAAVQDAYQQQFKQPLATIFAPEVDRVERTRWAWATFARRIETLSPFWLTFFLTIPGAPGLLALPIALANVSLAWGLGLILFFGLVNILTAAALAETVVRSGTARFGLGFLGQLAQEYLGKEVSALLTVVMIANNFLVLIIFFLGVGGTLADAVGGSTAFWIVPIFAVTLYFLSRRSLNTTIAVTLIIVWITLLMLLLIPLVSLPFVQLTHFSDAATGSPFAPATLGLLIGILSSTFLSHFLVATYGPVVLPRDPSGKGWIQGTIGAMFFFTLIACGWLLVVKGVLPVATLLNTTGTVLQPLAARVGGVIHLLGSTLVILGMGLTTIQVALGQYYLIEERLPARGSASWIGKLPDRIRFWLAVSPMLAILGLSEWFAITGSGSFAALLGILGALALPLIIGIIPPLLLMATRRQGDFVPGFVPRLLGHPLLVVLLYLFFIGNIVVYGVYIWDAWPLRLFALGGALVIFIVTGVMAWRNLWAVRTVIELRHDQQLHGISHLGVVSNGQPCAVDVVLGYPQPLAQQQTAHQTITDFPALQNVQIQLPATHPTHLKVWAHQVTPDGRSEGMPTQITVEGSDGQATTWFELPNGQLITPLSTAVQQVKIQWKAPASDG